MSSVINLINCLNRHLPTVEQIVEKYKKVGSCLENNQAVEILRQNTFNYFNDGDSVSTNTILELVRRTNIPSISIGAINIYMEVNAEQDIIEFASINDFYRIFFMQSNKELFFCDDESEDFELLTNNIKQFLVFLCEYHKYYMNRIFDVSYSSSESTLELNKLLDDGFSKKFVSLVYTS